MKYVLAKSYSHYRAFLALSTTPRDEEYQYISSVVTLAGLRFKAEDLIKYGDWWENTAYDYSFREMLAQATEETCPTHRPFADAREALSMLGQCIFCTEAPEPAKEILAIGAREFWVKTAPADRSAHTPQVISFETACNKYRYNDAPVGIRLKGESHDREADREPEESAAEGGWADGLIRAPAARDSMGS